MNDEWWKQPPRCFEKDIGKGLKADFLQGKQKLEAKEQLKFGKPEFTRGCQLYKLAFFSYFFRIAFVIVCEKNKASWLQSSMICVLLLWLVWLLLLDGTLHSWTDDIIRKAHLCFFQVAGDSFLVRSNTKNKRKKLPKVAQVGSFCPKIVLVFFWSHKKRFFDRRLWHGSVEIWHLRWVEKIRRLIKREREWLPWKKWHQKRISNRRKTGREKLKQNKKDEISLHPSVSSHLNNLISIHTKTGREAAFHLHCRPFTVTNKRLIWKWLFYDQFFTRVTDRWRLHY